MAQLVHMPFLYTGVFYRNIFQSSILYSLYFSRLITVLYFEVKTRTVGSLAMYVCIAKRVPPSVTQTYMKTMFACCAV
jgi:hypothetical protein